MATPNPLPTLSSPTGAGALSVKGAISGGTASVAFVWALETYGHTHLDPYSAAAVGSVGASVCGYVWHIIEVLVNIWVERLTRP
jgi:hypothetical protein